MRSFLEIELKTHVYDGKVIFMKKIFLISVLLIAKSACPHAGELSVKIIAVPGVRGNTKKIPTHIEGLGFKKGEYRVVRFSDIDDQGEWHQRSSHLGQIGDVEVLAKEIDKHEGPLNLVAESRGAATAINWDGLDTTTDKVKTIVAEASFLHVKDVPGDKIKLFRLLPIHTQNFLIRHRLPIKHKGCPCYDPAGLQPRISIARGTRPLLLIAAEHDHVVPGSHTSALYKIARDAGRTNVHMFTVPGKGHTGHLLDLDVQKVVHAFWAHYGAPHNPELAKQGALLFESTQPDCYM